MRPLRLVLLLVLLNYLLECLDSTTVLLFRGWYKGQKAIFFAADMRGTTGSGHRELAHDIEEVYETLIKNNGATQYKNMIVENGRGLGATTQGSRFHQKYIEIGDIRLLFAGNWNLKHQNPEGGPTLKADVEKWYETKGAELESKYIHDPSKVSSDVLQSLSDWLEERYAGSHSVIAIVEDRTYLIATKYLGSVFDFEVPENEAVLFGLGAFDGYAFLDQNEGKWKGKDFESYEELGDFYREFFDDVASKPFQHADGSNAINPSDNNFYGGVASAEESETLARVGGGEPVRIVKSKPKAEEEIGGAPKRRNPTDEAGSSGSADKPPKRSKKTGTPREPEEPGAEGGGGDPGVDFAAEGEGFDSVMDAGMMVEEGEVKVLTWSEVWADRLAMVTAEDAVMFGWRIIKRVGAFLLENLVIGIAVEVVEYANEKLRHYVCEKLKMESDDVLVLAASGTAYNYDYETQMIHTTYGPSPSLASAEAMKAEVEVFHPGGFSDAVALVRLRNVMIAGKEQVVVGWNEKLDFDSLSLKEISPRDMEVMSLPFQVWKLKDRETPLIFFSEGDETWSENHKRSVVDQLRLQEPDQMYAFVSPPNEENGTDAERNTSSYTIRKMEPTVQGVCLADYEVHYEDYEEEDPVIDKTERDATTGNGTADDEFPRFKRYDNVTQLGKMRVKKEWNLDKCRIRPHIRSFYYSDSAKAIRDEVDSGIVHEVEQGRPPSNRFSDLDRPEVMPLPVVLSSNLMSYHYIDVSGPTTTTAIYAQARATLTRVKWDTSRRDWFRVKNAARSVIHSFGEELLHNRFISTGQRVFPIEEEEESWSLAYIWRSIRSTAVSFYNSVRSLSLDDIKNSLLSLVRRTGRTVDMLAGPRRDRLAELLYAISQAQPSDRDRLLEELDNIYDLDDDEEQPMSMCMLQYLINKATTDPAAPIPVTTTTEEPAKQEELHLRPSYSPKLLAEIAEAAMRRMVESGDLGAHDEFATHFERFVRIVRLSTLDELAELRQRLASVVSTELRDPKEELVSQLYVDALTSACTHASLTEFAGLVESGKIGATNDSTLSNLMHCPMVSIHLLDKLWTLCEAHSKKAAPNWKQSCILSWAAMGRTLIQRDVRLSRETQEALVKNLTLIYESATILLDKLVGVVALGNLGSALSLDFLAKVIRAEQEEPLIRLQAISALRHISEPIGGILLPLFRDESIRQEIRMAAFAELAHSPDGELMGAVEEVLDQKTTSVDIRAFVQTTMTEKAEQFRHTDAEISSLIRTTLAHLNESGSYSMAAELTSSSKLRRYALYSSECEKEGDEVKYGVGITITTHTAKLDSMPTKWSVAIDTMVNGRVSSDQHFQLSVVAQCVEAALPPDAFRFFKHLFFQMCSDEPRLLLSMRTHGNDVAFKLLDKAEIYQLVADARVTRSVGALDSAKKYSASIGPETMLRIPSALGVPITISRSLPSLTSIMGSASFVLERATGAAISDFKYITLRSKMEVQASQTLVHRVETSSPLMESGIIVRRAYSARTPIDLDMKVNRSGEPMLLTRLGLQSPFDFSHLNSPPLFRAHSQSSTFMRAHYSIWTKPTHVWPKEKPLQDGAQQRLFEYQGTCPVTGLLFETKAAVNRMPQNDKCGAWNWLATVGNAIVVDAYPGPFPAPKWVFLRIYLTELTGQSAEAATTPFTSLLVDSSDLFTGLNLSEVQALRSYVNALSFDAVSKTETEMVVRLDAPMHSWIRLKLHYACFADNFDFCEVDGTGSLIREVAMDEYLFSPRKKHSKDISLSGQWAWIQLSDLFSNGTLTDHVMAQAIVKIGQQLQLDLHSYSRPSSELIWKVAAERSRTPADNSTDVRRLRPSATKLLLKEYYTRQKRVLEWDLNW